MKRRRSAPTAVRRRGPAVRRKSLASHGCSADSHAIDTEHPAQEITMNLANSRFTISTMAVAACAMVALVAAESSHAQPATPGEQRIEIVGQRPAPVQQVVIVGKRQAAPEVQRVVIVGKRPAEAQVQRVVIIGQRLRAESVSLSAAATQPATF